MSKDTKNQLQILPQFDHKLGASRHEKITEFVQLLGAYMSTKHASAAAYVCAHIHQAMMEAHAANGPHVKEFSFTEPADIFKAWEAPDHAKWREAIAKEMWLLQDEIENLSMDLFKLLVHTICCARRSTRNAA